MPYTADFSSLLIMEFSEARRRDDIFDFAICFQTYTFDTPSHLSPSAAAYCAAAAVTSIAMPSYDAMIAYLFFRCFASFSPTPPVRRLFSRLYFHCLF